MEAKKRWEEYSAEEKNTLLMHWFYYYGGILITLEDIENFKELLSSKQDEIFDHIITNYIVRNTIQSNVLIISMREGKVDQLFNCSVKKENIKPGREGDYEIIRQEIAKELVTTLNNPEPPVPMEIFVVDNTSEKKPTP